MIKTLHSNETAHQKRPDLSVHNHVLVWSKCVLDLPSEMVKYSGSKYHFHLLLMRDCVSLFCRFTSLLNPTCVVFPNPAIRSPRRSCNDLRNVSYLFNLASAGVGGWIWCQLGRWTMYNGRLLRPVARGESPLWSGGHGRDTFSQLSDHSLRG